MEVIVITLTIVLIIWKLGLFKPISVLADTAVREASLYNTEHKVSTIQRYKAIELNEEDVIKAANNKSVLDNFNFD